MKTVQHTPGPWSFGRNKTWGAVDGKARLVDAPGWFIGPEGRGIDIAAVHLTASQDPDTQEANARLLAAAPELLDELEAARKALANILDNCPYFFPAYGLKASLTPEQAKWREIVEPASKRARDAIRKAKDGAR